MNFFLVLLLYKIVLATSKSVEKKDDFREFVMKSGYESEAHEVETEDGYLLTVHRILAKPQKRKFYKNPVFLMHGFVATSGDFIVTGKENALGFLLADNGYDVWLGNTRGNKYSTDHKNLSVDSTEFWNFSFHEIGFYDLPAMIDYMLNVTKTSQTFYVGHSQGSTVISVLLSTRPEYNDKIIQAHLLSPVVFMTNFPNRLGKVFKPEVENGILDEFSYLNFDSFWTFSARFRDSFCSDSSNGFSCPSLVLLTFFFFGKNKEAIEIDTVSALKNIRTFDLF